ncbi:MAG: hypothetical protein QF415_11905 [Candidatus Undinarchaeales archaeon]|jgi:hypothetical protein|nr:hypothetical protein [Candidatus Undinarchaeales archaeon]MDP7492602.1 hypothetical protein [Candidatus Undinarchaeales archaeon]
MLVDQGSGIPREVVLLATDIVIIWLFLLYLFLPIVFTGTAGSLYCSWRDPGPQCEYATIVLAVLSPFLILAFLVLKYYFHGVNPDLERLARKNERVERKTKKRISRAE